ncbi:MAG: hypothetical protein JRF38_21375 [Deltaproteobacteria bacterium]|jgi:hypothetical protein|nr:hypothetical protein [Deltaproteobacteria bacterium]
MDAYKISLKVTSKKEFKNLLNFFVKNHFSFDPCSRYPQIREVEKNVAEVVIVAGSTGLKKLEDGGYSYEIVKDFSDEVDPREFVSKTNRFKAQLEKLKQSR